MPHPPTRAAAHRTKDATGSWRKKPRRLELLYSPVSPFRGAALTGRQYRGLTGEVYEPHGSAHSSTTPISSPTLSAPDGLDESLDVIRDRLDPGCFFSRSPTPRRGKCSLNLIRKALAAARFTQPIDLRRGDARGYSEVDEAMDAVGVEQLTGTVADGERLEPANHASFGRAVDETNPGAARDTGHLRANISPIWEGSRSAAAFFRRFRRSSATRRRHRARSRCTS